MPGKAEYGAVSHAVRAGTRGRRHLNLRGRKRRRARAARAARGHAAAAPVVKYIAVPPNMPISGLAIGPRGLANMLITDISQARCPPGTSELAVIEVEHAADILREIKLSQSPAADPSTRLQDRRITPGYTVNGGGSVTGGTLTLHASMVKRSTGRVVATASVSGPVDQFFELEAQLAARLIAEACKPELPASYTGTVTATADNGESWVANNVEYTQTERPELYTLAGGSVDWKVSQHATCDTEGSASFSLSAPDPYDSGAGAPAGGILWDFSTGRPRYEAYGTYGKRVTVHTVCGDQSFDFPYDAIPWWFSSGNPGNNVPDYREADPSQPLQGTSRGTWTATITWTWTLDPHF